jgi:glucose dehydrogenase
LPREPRASIPLEKALYSSSTLALDLDTGKLAWPTRTRLE